MNALDECHGKFTLPTSVLSFPDEIAARGFLWKSMGMCNDAKTAVNKCLRAQRLERTRLNREAAKVKREQIKEKWSEIDKYS
jgi:COX assembly protein 2